MIVKGIEFKDRSEEIAYMLANKSEIIQVKKAAIKYADAATRPPVIDATNMRNDNPVLKAAAISSDEDTDSAIKRTIIGNTYFWMDKHNDVHLGSTFKQSIKQRGDKVLHLHDHIYQVTAKVGEPISVYEDTVAWKDLGVNRSGETTSVFMDTEILKEYNPLVFNQYNASKIDQHSVGMYYVKVDLAADNEDYEQEYKLYKSVIDKLGNPERAEEKGYFWAVQEAKLVEISAVLAGSNELTPTLDAKTLQEAEDAEVKAALEFEEKRKKMLLKYINR